MRASRSRRKSKGRFIQGAIKRPGALTRKADEAGMSTQQYARKHEHDAGRTGEQARFDLDVLDKVRPGKQRRHGRRSERRSRR